MNIAIIGTGNVGTALGIRWAANPEHRVTFGTRDPSAEKVRALVDHAAGRARAAAPAAAARGAGVVLLATPWEATERIVRGLAPLDGKIVVDCTNPLGADLAKPLLPPGSSGGEEVARWAAGARVVKAFNTTGSDNMADAAYGPKRLAMPLCGDDPAAKRLVAGLAKELGFEPVDAGPLSRSRQLEALAILWIALAYEQGLGPDFGFAILKRPV